MPVNLLLWGGESWSGNAADIIKCEVLYHNAMRRTLKMSMSRAKEDRTKKKYSQTFLNQFSIEDMWRRSQLLFFGRTSRMSRMKNNVYPKIILSATTDSKRRRGRQHWTVRESMVENISLAVQNVGIDGRINRQMKYSKDAVNWECMVKNIEFRDWPNNSSDYEEDNDDADEDERVEDSINEPPKQKPP